MLPRAHLEGRAFDRVSTDTGEQGPFYRISYFTLFFSLCGFWCPLTGGGSHGLRRVPSCVPRSPCYLRRVLLAGRHVEVRCGTVLSVFFWCFEGNGGRGWVWGTASPLVRSEVCACSDRRPPDH